MTLRRRILLAASGAGWALIGVGHILQWAGLS